MVDWALKINYLSIYQSICCLRHSDKNAQTDIKHEMGKHLDQYNMSLRIVGENFPPRKAKIEFGYQEVL